MVGKKGGRSGGGLRVVGRLVEEWKWNLFCFVVLQQGLLERLYMW